jgi:hypothetical protein
MDTIRPTRSGAAKPVIAVLALAGIALSTALAAPLSAWAVGDPGIMICPPQITKVNTPVDFDVTDAESGNGYKSSLSSGQLPDGLRLEDVPGLNHVVVGTPTKVGSFRFTMHFENNVGGVGEKSCVMDIVPTASIVERIHGDDRYETAALVARKNAPDENPLDYVASGENYPDALSATAIAAQHNAPLVLSTPTGLTNFAYNILNGFKAADGSSSEAPPPCSPRSSPRSSA